MKAARVLRFGPPSAISMDDVQRPESGAGQLLVRVKAAGVGAWDALTREGTIQLQPLPLILGAELSGTVEAIGAEVSGLKSATKCTARPMNNSLARTRNTECPWLRRWRKNQRD